MIWETVTRMEKVRKIGFTVLFWENEFSYHEVDIQLKTSNYNFKKLFLIINGMEYERFWDFQKAIVWNAKF